MWNLRFQIPLAYCERDWLFQQVLVLAKAECPVEWVKDAKKMSIGVNPVYARALRRRD